MTSRTLFTAAGLLAVLALASHATAITTAWINEFHYDNTSGDTGEFVEVALPDSANPAQYAVTLYNGSDQQADDTHTMDTFTPGQSVGGFVLYYKYIAGIQNGSPDGMSLQSTGGSLIQFLSYEGSFTALDGPAAGATSEDIIVEQSSSHPVGFSLQLAGAGTLYYDFGWAGDTSAPLPASPGAVNILQQIGEVEPDEIPEPATLIAGLAGLAGVGRYLRRRG